MIVSPAESFDIAITRHKMAQALTLLVCVCVSGSQKRKKNHLFVARFIRRLFFFIETNQKVKDHEKKPRTREREREREKSYWIITFGVHRLGLYHTLDRLGFLVVWCDVVGCQAIFPRPILTHLLPLLLHIRFCMVAIACFFLRIALL